MSARAHLRQAPAQPSSAQHVPAKTQRSHDGTSVPPPPRPWPAPGLGKPGRRRCLTQKCFACTQDACRTRSLPPSGMLGPTMHRYLLRVLEWQHEHQHLRRHASPRRSSVRAPAHLHAWAQRLVAFAEHQDQPCRATPPADSMLLNWSDRPPCSTLLHPNSSGLAWKQRNFPGSPFPRPARGRCCRGKRSLPLGSRCASPKKACRTIPVPLLWSPPQLP
mmetsp:Transcript_40829/g.88933  ORF Transcript_40829/g.88933 Transcript_40829/m.88933 type:complete len:219 (+) Transcript_40829:377-1033(+)